MARANGAYRVGVVGYRGRGRGLARYWQGVEGAKLVAVADDTPEHLEAARAELGEINTYPLHTDMLESEELDIVTVGTRAKFRPPIIRDVAASGVRGIYAEKPMANSLADADAMIDQCKASGTVLTIGHQRRWSKQIRAVRQHIKDGRIGTPTHGSIYWGTARVGSNGTHFFDALNFILDSTPVEVVGKVSRQLSTKLDADPEWSERLAADPGAFGFIIYANGVRMAVDCMSDVLLPYTYMFCGTRGRLDVFERGWQVQYRARSSDVRSIRDAKENYVQTEIPPLPVWVDDEAVQSGYRELMECIETGARPTSSGEDGRLVLETIVAFHISSDAGMTPVRLPLPESARSYRLTIDERARP